MTSRTLFFKLSWEEMKHKIWLTALLCLLLFCAMPLTGAMQTWQSMESVVEAGGLSYETEAVYRVLRDLGYSGLLTAITIIAGAVSGIAMFSYLFSKKQVDLVHSLPVKRSMLFCVKYLSGLFLYLGTVVLNLIILVLVMAGAGAFTSDLIPGLLQISGQNLLGFLVVYNFAAIGTVLCGNLVVSGLLSLLLVLLPNMVWAIVHAYSERFFDTYVYNELMAERILNYVAPVQRYVFMISNTYFVNDKLAAPEVADVLFLLASVVILTTVLAVLFIRRPSEGAGKALAFSKAAFPVRLLIVIPTTLLVAYAISELVGESLGWLIFGLFFGFLLSAGVVNMVIYFDFRKAFARPCQMLVCGLAVLAVFCCFSFDLPGYDRYLPKEEKLASMGMGIANVVTNDGYFAIAEEAGNSFQYVSRFTKLDAQTLPPELAYEFAEWLWENNQDGFVTTTEQELRGIYAYSNCTIKYELTSGRSVYRNYKLPVAEETLAFIEKLYDSQEYKEYLYPVLCADARYIESASINGANTTVELNPETNERLVSLIQTYQTELRALTAEQLKGSTQIGEIEAVFYYEREGSARFSSIELPIYSEFTKTIAMLDSWGISLELRAEEIQRIHVYQYQQSEDVYEASIAEELYSSTSDYFKEDTAFTAVFSKNFYEAEEIEQLLPVLLPFTDQYGEAILEPESEEGLHATIFFEPDEYGNQNAVECMFRAGEIPEFLYK